MFNTVGIFQPNEILLHHNSSSSVSFSVRPFAEHASYFIHPLFPWLSLSPLALGIPLQYHFWNSVTSNPFQSSNHLYHLFLHYHNNFVLDIHYLSNFQIPNFLLSWFPCHPPPKIHLCSQSFICMVSSYCPSFCTVITLCTTKAKKT